jgi:hypothetical protein
VAGVAAGGPALALIAARHREIGIQRHVAARPAIAGRNRAHHHRGVEDMVVEREIVGRDLRDPAVGLLLPIGGAHGFCDAQKLVGGGLACPIGFEREFQFTAPANARHAEGGDGNFCLRHDLPRKFGGMGQRTHSKKTARDGPRYGTPGHPARGRFSSRQVSWLAGRRFCPSSQGPRPPVTCWTSSRRLQLRGQRRHLTGFPLSLGASKATAGEP